MRVYSTMPDDEFIAGLRDIAISARASPLMIDKLDGLRSVDELEREHEAVILELEEERDQAIDDRDTATARAAELEAVLRKIADYQGEDIALVCSYAQDVL